MFKLNFYLMKPLRSQIFFEYSVLFLSSLFFIFIVSYILVNNQKTVTIETGLHDVGLITKGIPMEKSTGILSPQSNSTGNSSNTNSNGSSTGINSTSNSTNSTSTNSSCISSVSCFYNVTNLFGWSAGLYCNNTLNKSSFVNCTGLNCSCTNCKTQPQKFNQGNVSGSGDNFQTNITLSNNTNVSGIGNCNYPIFVNQSNCSDVSFKVTPYCNPSSQTNMKIHFTIKGTGNGTLGNNYTILIYNAQTGFVVDNDTYVQSVGTGTVFNSKTFGSNVSLPENIFFEVTACNTCGNCVSDNKSIDKRSCNLD